MRLVLALALALTYTAGGHAQTRTPAPGTPAPGVAAPPQIAIETDARQVREQFEVLLMKYPPEVGRILKMDPTMLTNEQYLAQYPGIQQFLAVHPEVARNPSFYLDFVRISGEFRSADPQSRVFDMWRDLLQSMSIFVFLAFAAGMLAWLVRTVLNHRRWLRTSKTQTDVHHKLLERFSGTNELLAYVQSPAGRRFLEAAPIPLDAAAVDRPVSAPLNRILWSVQAGIVLVVGGLGFQFVSGRVSPDVGEGIWTIGVLATAFGLGFILAGVFSYMMSRRLGLLDPSVGTERGDTPAA